MINLVKRIFLLFNLLYSRIIFDAIKLYLMQETSKILKNDGNRNVSAREICAHWHNYNILRIDWSVLGNDFYH